MLAALCLTALLAAAGVQDASAAPAACSLAANAKCTLTQCPCYKAQIDDATYARPPGCTAEATPADVNITGDVEMCRYTETAFPEPGEYVPQQIHIMPANTVFTSMFIVWVTGHVTEILPDLPYTTNPYNINPLNESAPGDALSYVWISTYQPAVGPAGPNTVPSGRGGALIKADPTTANAVYKSLTLDYSSPVIHTVTVPNLQTGSTYYYKVGDPTKPNGVSKVMSFHVPCTNDSSSYPFRLGCIADVGQTFNSTTTLTKLQADKPDAVVLAGDLTYADDYNADDRTGYQPRWDIWGRITQSLFSTIPLITTIGNHEEESEFTFGDDYTMTTGCNYPGADGVHPDCARAFVNRYPTPYKAAGSTAPFWYSVNVGPVHIIYLSNYNPTCNSISNKSLSCPLGNTTNSPQYTWLVKDLAAYKRTTNSQWLMVVFHEPYYSTEGSYGLAGYFQQNLEPLLYKYGVDIVMTGHVHAYERFFPVYQGVIDECAPVYFVVGDAGNEEGPDSYSGTDPAYSAFRESSFGHGLMDFVNSTTAVWNWQRNQDPAASKTSDTVTITRATSTNTKCANRGYVAKG